jgi:hypothetical protein
MLCREIPPTSPQGKDTAQNLLNLSMIQELTKFVHQHYMKCNNKLYILDMKMKRV